MELQHDYGLAPRQLRSIHELEIIRLKRNFLLDEEEDTYESKASNLVISIQIMKTMVGLGIFVLPHTVKEVGILGFAIFYPLILYTMTLFITLVIKAANDIGYYGSSFGELHEIILGPRFRFISEFGILVNSFATSISLLNAPSKTT